MTHPTPDSQITPLDEKTELFISTYKTRVCESVHEGSTPFGQLRLARVYEETALNALRSRIKELQEEARKEGYWKVVPGHGDVPDGIVPR